MSVGGVSGRFHCFACGVGGDVIDHVRRRRGCAFTEAVHALEHDTSAPPAPARMPRSSPPARRFTTTSERVIEVNDLAWAHVTAPDTVLRAEGYLCDERGIDTAALQEANGGAPLTGYVPASRTGLIGDFRDHGVSVQEMLDADLTQTSRHGRIIDMLRDRVILPVRDQDGAIRGFIGRALSDDQRAPKYRNPTRTPAFDKATALYRPIHHAPASDATVVVVERALDAPRRPTRPTSAQTRRGSSSNPAVPGSQNRSRHSITVGRLTPTRAKSVVPAPSATVSPTRIRST